mgnify:CR=1 FL=1
MDPPGSVSARDRLEGGLVDVFAELADLFGNPRSHGQIYGLLFSSPHPLSMDDITEKIGITASEVWRYSFRGLHRDKNLTLLGLDPRGNRRARYTFGSMSALRPEDVLKALPQG